MIILRHQSSRVGPLAALILLALAGCTQSETPLTSRENGFIDFYLLGRWHDLDLNDQGQLITGDLAYDISLADNGDLRVLQYDGDEAEYHEYSVYSSRLKSKKYVNARLVDCAGCSEQERASIAASHCPYQIAQYTTFLPQSIAAHFADDAGEEVANAVIELAATSRGNMVFLAGMHSEFVESAIKEEALAGDISKDAACITSREAVLREFLLQNDRDIYPVGGWGVLIRSASR